MSKQKKMVASWYRLTGLRMGMLGPATLRAALSARGAGLHPTPAGALADDPLAWPGGSTRWAWSWFGDADEAGLVVGGDWCALRHRTWTKAVPPELVEELLRIRAAAEGLAVEDDGYDELKDEITRELRARALPTRADVMLALNLRTAELVIGASEGQAQAIAGELRALVEAAVNGAEDRSASDASPKLTLTVERWRRRWVEQGQPLAGSALLSWLTDLARSGRWLVSETRVGEPWLAAMVRLQGDRLSLQADATSLQISGDLVPAAIQAWRGGERVFNMLGSDFGVPSLQLRLEDTVSGHDTTLYFDKEAEVVAMSTNAPLSPEREDDEDVVSAFAEAGGYWLLVIDAMARARLAADALYVAADRELNRGFSRLFTPVLAADVGEWPQVGRSGIFDAPPALPEARRGSQTLLQLDVSCRPGSSRSHLAVSYADAVIAQREADKREATAAEARAPGQRSAAELAEERHRLVLSVLTGEPASVEAVAERAALDHEPTSRSLARLVALGVAERTGRGLYVRKPDANAARSAEAALTAALEAAARAGAEAFAAGRLFDEHPAELDDKERRAWRKGYVEAKGAAAPASAPAARPAVAQRSPSAFDAGRAAFAEGVPYSEDDVPARLRGADRDAWKAGWYAASGEMNAAEPEALRVAR